MRVIRVARRAGFAIVVVVVMANIGAVKFVRDAYPADPFKSTALEKCLAADRGFIRFSAEQRAHCYARQPHQALGFHAPG